MALYFLFIGRSGGIALGVLQGDAKGLRVTNQGFGPYDVEPTQEMISAIQNPYIVLPCEAEMREIFGLVMPLDEYESLCRRAESTTCEIIKSLKDA